LITGRRTTPAAPVSASGPNEAHAEQCPKAEHQQRTGNSLTAIKRFADNAIADINALAVNVFRSRARGL
jgi:hypothetical protein